MNTTAPTPPMMPTAKPRRRWLRRLTVWACVALTLLAALHVTWLLVARADLRAARTEATAAGLSLAIEDVIPPPCAEADNAALLYQRAFGLLTLGGSPYVPGKDQGRLDARLTDLLDQSSDFIGMTFQDKSWKAFTPGQREAALALLDGEDFGRVWNLVAEGARLPRCRFAYAYEQGPGMLMPELSMVRSMVRLGLIRAQLLAEVGKAQAASDQLADLLWLRRQLLEEPILISTVSGNALEIRILTTLRDLMADGKLHTADLSHCRHALLTEAERSVAITRSINAEVVLMGVWIFNYLEKRPYNTMSSLQSDLDQAVSPLGKVAMRIYASWIGSPLRAADEATYLRTMTAIYRSSGEAGVSDRPLTYLHPVTALLLPSSAHITKSGIRKNERLTATASVALAIAAGETPQPVPGVDVSTDAEGETLVTPASNDVPGEAKKILVPWRVKR